MNFLIENNYLDILNKLELVTYFDEYIYLLENENIPYSNKLGYLFCAKYYVPILMHYSSEDDLNIYEEMQIYINKYPNIINFIKLLASDIYYEPIDIPCLKKWKFRMFSSLMTPNEYFNLIYNLHEHKITFSNNIEYDCTADLSAIEYFKNNEYSEGMFYSICIKSDIIKNKIRQDFDISFFDPELVSDRIDIFQDIYGYLELNIYRYNEKNSGYIVI